MRNILPAFSGHPETRIGHVHLKVSAISRALTFWRDLLGLQVKLERSGATFLSAGGYHHHIPLNTGESADGTPPSAYHTGPLHVALLYPDHTPWRRCCNGPWRPR